MSKLRQFVENGQEISYHYKLSHVDKDFESWMNRRITEREKETVRSEELKKIGMDKTASLSCLLHRGQSLRKMRRL